MAKSRVSKNPLVDIQNEIRGSRQPINTLSAIRYKIPVEKMGQFVSWLPSVRRNGRPIFEHQFPKSASELLAANLFAPISFAKELAWASATVKSHAKKLAQFRTLVSAFENQLLGDNGDSALETLNVIERNFGMSFWLLEVRIATLQRVKGLEAQKTYLSLIRQQCGDGTIPAYVAFYLSLRNEKATNPQRLNDQLAMRLENADVQEPLRAYLKHRLLHSVILSEDDIANVLRLDATSAVIDCYESLVWLASDSLIMDNQISAALIREIVTLSGGIPADTRLKKILVAANIVASDEIEDRQDIQNDDLFAKGQYQEVIAQKNYGLRGLVREARARGILDLHPNSEEKTALTELLLHSTRLATDAGGSENDVHELLHTAYNFRVTNLGNVIEDYLLDEAAVKTGPRFERRSAIRAFISSPSLDPEVLPHLPSSARMAYAQILKKRYGYTPFVVAQILSSGLDEASALSLSIPSDSGISEELANEVAMEGCLRRTQYDQAISIAESTYATTTVTRFKNRAEQYQSAALLQSGNIRQLCKLIVSRCLADPEHVSIFPITACAERLDKQTRRDLAAELTTSIVLDLYCSRINDELARIRAYAYEDFLFAHRVERPSQLSDIARSLDQNELIYYLRYICVPEIMQNSSVFKGTRELEVERLAVLAMLVKLDSAHVQDYEAETRKITRDQLIQRAVRDVEQSKIYVDIVAIKRWAEQNLRDSFQRLKALRAAGVGAADKISLQEALHDVVAGKPVPEQLLQLPDDEVTDLLLDIVRTLLRQCTSNPVHGLDCYLSMRIRHGTLSGQLRSPLETEHMVTYREAGSSEYRPNEYWLQKLADISYVNASSIADRLAEFSAEYDRQIDWVANELIQIWGSEKPNGWFKIGIPALEIQLLVSQVDRDISLEDFLEQCFQLFWESLGSCLKDISRIMEEKIKPLFFGLLENLERDVHQIALEEAVPDLDRAIRMARTGVSQALDRVERWFKLSKATTTPVSSFIDLLEVGLQGVRNIHADFDPIIEREIAELPDLAGGLTLFSDIFFIIFDNIRRHSGIVERPRVWVNVTRTENKLRIRIENELSSGTKNASTEAKVSAIRDKIKKGDYQQSVRLEGGSGLIKLRKLIGSEQPQTLQLNFGFKDQDRFFVELEVSILRETYREAIKG